MAANAEFQDLAASSQLSALQELLKPLQNEASDEENVSLT